VLALKTGRQERRGARRIDAGKRFEALDGFLEEGRLLGGIFVARTGKRDVCRQDLIRVNSETSVNSVEKLLDEKSCCDQEHQRQGDFRSHEDTVCPVTGSALRTRPATFFEIRLEVQGRLVKSRRQAEKDGCENRYAECEGQHGMIDGHFVHCRSDLVDRAEAATEQVHTPGSKQQAQPAASESDQEAFDQQLANQAETTRAQRRAQAAGWQC